MLRLRRQFIFVPYSDTESKKRKRRHSTTEIQIQLSSSLWYSVYLLYWYKSTNSDAEGGGRSAAAGFFSGLGIVYELNDYTADGTIADYIAGAQFTCFTGTKAQILTLEEVQEHCRCPCR